MRESRLPREALSGLSESLRALRSLLLSASGLSAGCEPLRLLFGAHESSYVVAWRCSLCSLCDVMSGLVLESLRLLLLPHCVVESRRAFGLVGLVAGGVTELVMIVGGGRERIESVPMLTVCVLIMGNNPPPPPPPPPFPFPFAVLESDAVELVEGRDSWRFGTSDAIIESFRLRVALITFGGGGERPMAESRRLLR